MDSKKIKSALVSVFSKDGLEEIVRELDKKPIVIKILNIRVDTARDLVLKLYNTSGESTC